MKRALVIFITILAVMLVFSTPMPSAKTTPADKDSPSIISSPLIGGGPGYSGDDDEGDGDSVAGYRDGNPNRPPGSSGSGYDLTVKAWWTYLLFMQIRIGI